jgi:hypothetical protein
MNLSSATGYELFPDIIHVNWCWTLHFFLVYLCFFCHLKCIRALEWEILVLFTTNNVLYFSITHNNLNQVAIAYLYTYPELFYD